jgi:hypothetical protein
MNNWCRKQECACCNTHRRSGIDEISTAAAMPQDGGKISIEEASVEQLKEALAQERQRRQEAESKVH